ncbi:hypothetical protein V8G54_008673 [Vigna mungo]|uniref:Uncharacterized protein n=1 Tax=Vigna mungo TaxID=3915 RepID=A0AAQ3P5L9_VIGMU
MAMMTNFEIIRPITLSSSFRQSNQTNAAQSWADHTLRCAKADNTEELGGMGAKRATESGDKNIIPTTTECNIRRPFHTNAASDLVPAFDVGQKRTSSTNTWNGTTRPKQGKLP